MKHKKTLRSNKEAEILSRKSIIIIAILFLVGQAVLYADIIFAANNSSKEDIMGDENIPWHISANTLIYEEETQTYIAKGDVRITNGTKSIEAHKAIYNTKTGIANLEGDIRLMMGGDILTGQKGAFNLNSQTARINKGCLFIRENHYYIYGSEMEKLTDDTYLIKDCSLTTCSGDKPAWTINGSEVRVTKEGYGIVKHASFKARRLPFFYFPYLVFPVKTKRQSGLLPPQIGYSTLNGFDIEIPFYWAISDQTDATFFQRYLSKRGYLQGVEYRYLANRDSRGTFLLDVIKDKINEKDMNDPDALEISPGTRDNQMRYWLRGKLDQKLPYGLMARFDLDVVSDQDYLREFHKNLFGSQSRSELDHMLGRPVEEIRSPTRHSALRLNGDTEGYCLQAMASYDQTPEELLVDDVAHPLISLNYTMLPVQLFNLSAFFSLETDYDYIIRDDIWKNEAKNGHRIFLAPELKLPLWLFDRYLEFEPSIKYFYNIQSLEDPLGERDNLHKSNYEATIRLATCADRIFNFEWKDVKKLKHKISPVLKYTYHVNQDESDSFWYEERDGKSDRNMLSFSLENSLDAKSERKNGRVSYRQWMALDLSQGYDLDEARDNDKPEEKKEPFAPLNLLLSLYPFPALDLYGNINWDHYESVISSASLSCKVAVNRSGGRQDKYDISYYYTKDRKKNLALDIDFNLSERISITYLLARDMEMKENILAEYWLNYRSQCWGLSIGFEKEEEKEKTLMLIIHLLGFGNIKAL